MVFLEVAAAGALIYGHQRRKFNQEQYRAEAEEDLKRRGWDGGAKQHHDDHVRRQNSGLTVPSPTGPQRPLSAPPAQGWQSAGGKRAAGDDDLAYGSFAPPSPPRGRGGGSGKFDDGLAYGKSYQPPAPDQPYLPPQQQGPPMSGWQGPPPPQFQYQQQPPVSPPPPYPGSPPPAGPQPPYWQQQQAPRPPIQHVQSWGPGGPAPQEGFPVYQGPPPGTGQGGWGGPPGGGYPPAGRGY